jgi:hypothetical protein
VRESEPLALFCLQASRESKHLLFCFTFKQRLLLSASDKSSQQHCSQQARVTHARLQKLPQTSQTRHQQARHLTG